MPGLGHVKHIAQSPYRLGRCYARDDFDLRRLAASMLFIQEMSAWVRDLLIGHRDTAVCEGGQTKCALAVQIDAKIEIFHGGLSGE